MAELIARRNRIKLNSPHLATASGSIASFSTDMRSPLEKIKIHFNPQQSGSGNPSPSNIRPITGWTGCDIIISPTQVEADGNKIPVSWSSAGTVYGGWANPISGEVWMTDRRVALKDAKAISYNSSELTAWANYIVIPEYSVNALAPKVGFPITECPVMCDTFIATPQSGGILSRNQTQSVVWMSSVDGTFRIKTQDYCSLTAAQFKEQFGDVEFVYELNTPQLVGTLTPTQIKTLVGANNIWSNANGNVDVKYWKH